MLNLQLTLRDGRLATFHAWNVMSVEQGENGEGANVLVKISDDTVVRVQATDNYKELIETINKVCMRNTVDL